MAAAVAAGRRVLIRPPTARDRDELLALMRSSRGFLRPWVENVSQIFRGNFRSAYLGFSAGAPFERWAVTVEGLQR